MFFLRIRIEWMNYIHFEGLDKVGKTTAISELMGRLNNAILVTEPSTQNKEMRGIKAVITGGDHISNKVKTYLSIGQRINVLEEEVEPYFKKYPNNTVISDRGFISNAVYQSDTIGDLYDILDMNMQIMEESEYTLPTLIVYMEISFKEYLVRLNKDLHLGLDLVETKLTLKDNFDIFKYKYDLALEYVEYNFGISVIRTNDVYEVLAKIK